MINKVKGGKKITVEGFDCYTPPVPPDDEIQNSHLPKKDQKWGRTPLPTFKVRDIEWFSGEEQLMNADDEISWEAAVREETLKITGTDPWNTDIHGNPKKIAGVEPDPNYYSPPVEKFRAQELHRLFHGHWIMIKGMKIYLTGAYYTYLNWWKLESGYPDFRDPDRKLFYLVEYVRRHPFILGLLYITMRGVGKSYIAGLLNYYEAVTSRKAITGIQSKNDNDAEKLFKEQILTPVADLPEFLIPIHRHTGDITKNNELNFSPPSRRNMDYRAYRTIQKEALRSYMSFANSREYAYDRATLRHLIEDEIGKTPLSVCNVEDRLNVVLDCVWRGDKKRGWIFATTTVEKMEEGGEQCKNIWYKSDIAKATKLGRPPSGLIRIFISALDNTFFDEYGFPKREEARQYHEEILKTLDKESDYISYVQKHPFSIEQAFQYMGKDCIYNRQILEERQVFLSDPDNQELTVRGDFEWVEEWKSVRFVENRSNGAWLVAYLFEDPKKANNVYFTYGVDDEIYIHPKNNHMFTSGIDPVSHYKVKNKSQASDCAATIKMKDNMFQPDLSNVCIAHYLYRSHDPKVDYENIAKGLIYYGCQALIESNKSNLINYYYEVGMDSFVMSQPESMRPGKPKTDTETDGVASGRNTINHYVNSTKTHITRHGHKEVILPIIQNWIEFDPHNTQKYDSAVSASLAIVAEEKPMEEESEAMNIETFMSTWDNSGETAKMN